MSFKSLKKNRVNIRKKIASEVKADGQSSFKKEVDERLWYPKSDEKGSATTHIRFLPPAEGQTLPWAKRYRHAFKGPKGWFIENCPTSIDKPCPVCEANRDLWQTEIESNKKLASMRKRKQEYYYNIQVIKDRTQEGVEGQNKIFKTGPYIFKMIQSAQNPEFEDETPIDAFDLWEGADFNFKMYKDAESGQLTYKKSSFGTQTKACGGDEAEMEKVYEGMFDLSGYTDEKEFKSYADLEKRFNQVTASTSAPTKTAETMQQADATENKSDESPFVEDESAAAPKDDALAMFEELANG